MKVEQIQTENSAAGGLSDVLGADLQLNTYGADGVRQSVRVGDSVSACVRRAFARQMYWYPATVIRIDGDLALVELKNHTGERAMVGAKSIRVCTVAPNAQASGRPGRLYGRDRAWNR